MRRASPRARGHFPFWIARYSPENRELLGHASAYSSAPSARAVTSSQNSKSDCHQPEGLFLITFQPVEYDRVRGRG